MASDDDNRIGERAASLTRGSVIAAAGCGKTEQIARATALSQGRRLILTHTHAGVDALKVRLKNHTVADNKYRIDTIAGWSLRFAASFPMRSGLSLTKPADDEWNTVYECAARLVTNRAVSGVLAASYSGVFVDEYQDCTGPQHEIICALATHLPTCVFGDPLQGIFDFKEQKAVDWDVDVFPLFEMAGELLTPWRWKKAGNTELAKWLEDARGCLENGQTIHLNGCPACVSWEHLPAASKSKKVVAERQAAMLAACKSVTVQDGETLVVIGDSANLKARANLAQKLAKYGFANIEPIGCKDLFEQAASIESLTGVPRLEAVLAFAASCMTGANKSALTQAAQSHLAGRRQGAAKFGELLPHCLEITQSGSWHPVLGVLEAMRLRSETRLYRREMFFAMRSALRLMATGQYRSLTDAIWETQNRIRHTGRNLGKRSIGSTLLVKGLEFDHAIIVDADGLSRKNLYVALTRPMRSLTILSRSQKITPRA